MREFLNSPFLLLSLPQACYHCLQPLPPPHQQQQQPSEQDPCEQQQQEQPSGQQTQQQQHADGEEECSTGAHAAGRPRFCSPTCRASANREYWQVRSTLSTIKYPRWNPAGTSCPESLLPGHVLPHLLEFGGRANPTQASRSSLNPHLSIQPLHPLRPHSSALRPPATLPPTLSSHAPHRRRWSATATLSPCWRPAGIRGRSCLS